MSVERPASLRLKALAQAFVMAALAACGGGDEPPTGELLVEEPSTAGELLVEGSTDAPVRTEEALAADTTRPTITVDGKSEPGATVRIYGRATDNLRINRVQWSNNRGGFAVATLSGSYTSATWSASNIPLKVGTNEITFAVYDSAGNRASKTVSISRASVPTTSAVLTWTAVADARVTGYRVYYGTASRTYVQSAGRGLSAGANTTYTISNLGSGKKYYFAVTAVDSAGRESAYSSEAVKSIP